MLFQPDVKSGVGRRDGEEDAGIGFSIRGICLCLPNGQPAFRGGQGRNRTHRQFRQFPGRRRAFDLIGDILAHSKKPFADHIEIVPGTDRPPGVRGKGRGRSRLLREFGAKDLLHLVRQGLLPLVCLKRRRQTP